LNSDEFAACARSGPKDFTRERNLPLPALVALLVNLRKGTIQDELDQFVESSTEGPRVRAVSASAFCQARQKLDPQALMGSAIAWRRPSRPVLRGAAGADGACWRWMAPPCGCPRRRM
jgi:hypothetical protein